jgi:hypothetical protein
MTPEAAAPLAVLERWEAHGATWRVRTLTATFALVELCTCHGTPVDELRSNDPELIRFLSARELPTD